MRRSTFGQMAARDGRRRNREEGMKLSQIRPCDNCRGKIAPVFYVFRISQAIFTPEANRTLAMMQYLGGNVELGELFAPGSDDAVVVMGDKEKELMLELFICQQCFLKGPLDLAILWERRHEEIEQERRKQEQGGG